MSENDDSHLTMGEPEEHFLVTSQGRYNLTPPTEGPHAKPHKEFKFVDQVEAMRRFQKLYAETGSEVMRAKAAAAEAAVDAFLEL